MRDMINQMKRYFNSTCSRLGDSDFLRKFHGWATVIWLILLVPSVLWWKTSIVWIVVMSAWANLAGHFSSWQASRIEVKQDIADPNTDTTHLE